MRPFYLGFYLKILLSINPKIKSNNDNKRNKIKTTLKFWQADYVRKSPMK